MKATLFRNRHHPARPWWGAVLAGLACLVISVPPAHADGDTTAQAAPTGSLVPEAVHPDADVLDADVLIIGASAGGTAAALAAAQAGVSVILVGETDWLGGQLTAQGVSTPDEHAYMERFGGTRAYYQLRQGIRAYYRTHYHLAAGVAGRAALNPGDCWVGPLSYEPKVGQQVLREMLRPLEASGRLRVFPNTHAVATEADPGNQRRIVAVQAVGPGGRSLRFTARYVLDATDTGELLALSGRQGQAWTQGAEGRAQTQEPDAPAEAHPDWVQPMTFPFALEWSPRTAAANRIPRPDGYEALRERQNYSLGDGVITGAFRGPWAWWSYRRLLSARNFADPAVPADIAMINTAANDDQSGNVLTACRAAVCAAGTDVSATLAEARQVSRGYLYWLQTEAPRDGSAGRGYPELRLRADLFDTPDGCAPEPYVRESRRILALRTVTEQEIVVRDRAGRPYQMGARAVFMPDSVGIGFYPIDIHTGRGGDGGGGTPTRPFQIPLGAMIPVAWENLLPACKDIGTTHLTNGAYRLHPVEWNIGESAGELAAFCLQTGRAPRDVSTNPAMRWALQCALVRRGVPLYWFLDVPLDHPAFEAVQMLAQRGIPLGGPADLLFRPGRTITAAEWRAWHRIAGAGPVHFHGTRAQAALALYRAVAALSVPRSV